MRLAILNDVEIDYCTHKVADGIAIEITAIHVPIIAALHGHRDRYYTETSPYETVRRTIRDPDTHHLEEYTARPWNHVYDHILGIVVAEMATIRQCFEDELEAKDADDDGNDGNDGDDEPDMLAGPIDQSASYRSGMEDAGRGHLLGW